MNNIIWIASYPKSGNTWFRAFISNLISEKDEIVNINNLKTNGIFSSRELLDSITGIESSNLTFDEIDELRPKAYNYIATRLENNLYIKVHDAYTYIEKGKPLLGTTNAKIIYIIRNPLDVAVSFSNHLSEDLDTTIRNMGDENFKLSGIENKLENKLRQRLLSWSMHVESFENASEIPVHIIKYEDMKLDPVRTFTQAVKFIGLSYDEEQIKEAVLKSDFKKLKEEEQKHGFKEKPFKAEAFFRKGIVGDWKNHLTEEQVNMLIQDHKEVMIKFSYIDGKENILY